MEYSEDQIRQFEVYRHKLLNEISDSISHFTVQFFFDNKKGLPKATGSGIFLEVENRHFVITAAHVIAEHPNDTYIVIGNAGVYLGGLLHYVALQASQKRNDDKIDLAFIELDKAVIDLIKTQHKFLTLNDIQIGHVPTSKLQYLAFGYPSTKTKLKKVRNENLILASPFSYNSKIHPDFKYERFGFRNDIHIAIKFTGEIISNINKAPHLAPDLAGISGSGLWYLINFPSIEIVQQRRLVGITIERVNELDNKVLIAISIDVLTEFLRNNLGISTLPKSSKINIKSKII